MSKLEAGPELDALVAEKVMGLPVYRDLDHGFPHLGVKGSYRAIPDYSTDIAAAWTVVEKIRAEPWYRGITVTDAPTQGGSYTCEVWSKRDGVTGREVEYVASTAPLAICLAALKAVGQ